MSHLNESNPAVRVGKILVSSDLVEFLPSLRRVLEDRLSEEPTPDNSRAAREEGRVVIQKLLVRLRDKSALYWQSESRSEVPQQYPRRF